MYFKTIAAAALLTMLLAVPTAMAQDGSKPLTINLANVCKNGCIVKIKVPKIKDGSHAGEFQAVGGTGDRLLEHFAGFSLNSTGKTLFQLVNEPGGPIFLSLDEMYVYIEAHDRRVRKGRGKAAG